VTKLPQGFGSGLGSRGLGFGKRGGVHSIGDFGPGFGSGFGPGFGLGVGNGYGYGFGYWGGIGALYNGLDVYNDYRVPYFAAHPPVYYSHPVPRTYGHSPFAYPPHFRTPEIYEEVVPLTINNPYVPSQETPAAESNTADETVSAPAPQKPLVVVNPFVVDPSLASTER
jgi:hypothetical protein